MSLDYREVRVTYQDSYADVKLIVMAGEEGLTTGQVSDLLGVSPVTIRRHAQEHGLSFVQISSEILPKLRQDNVISMKGRAPKWVPKETIRQLVKHVGTDKAQAIYDQLWKLAEENITGKATTQETLNVLDGAAHSLRALMEYQEKLSRDLAVEQEAHLTTKANAKINIDQAAKLTRAIEMRAHEISKPTFKWRGPMAGNIKKLVKVVFQEAPGHDTRYKEIALKDYERALEFVDTVDANLTKVAGRFGNNDYDLLELKEWLAEYHDIK